MPDIERADNSLTVKTSEGSLGGFRLGEGDH